MTDHKRGVGTTSPKAFNLPSRLPSTPPPITLRAMLNPRLDLLTDYPFDRLRSLLDGVHPPDGVTPLMLSIGEPQHAPPALVQDTITATDPALWGKYPPLAGTEGWRDAVTGWLTRRYGLAEGLIDGARHVLPVAGTREALFWPPRCPFRKKGTATNPSS